MNIGLNQSCSSLLDLKNLWLKSLPLELFSATCQFLQINNDLQRWLCRWQKIQSLLQSLFKKHKSSLLSRKKIIWEAQPKSFIVTTHTVVVHTKHAGVRVTAGLAHTFSNLNEFKLKVLTYKMQISSSTTTLVLVVSQSEFI